MPNNPKTFFKSLRHLFLVFIFVLGLITVVASGGGGGDDSSDTTDDTTDDTTTFTYAAYGVYPLPTVTSFTDSTYNLSAATNITLNGSSISVSGTGATASGSIVTITAAGTYNITGMLSNGQIKVNTADTGDVRLYFNGVNVTYSTASPVDIESAERVIMVLADSSQNYLTDGTSNSSVDGDGEAIDATLFSKDDLIIYGGGSLTVDANYLDGIKCKDGLIIASGTITVTSKDDGIIGKNYVSVQDGDIFITAGGDGLKATNENTDEQGYIVIGNGVFDITAGADAIQAQTHVVVKGGTFDLTTAGGHANPINFDTETAKGFKANIGVTIDGGSFIVDSADDSFHSDDTIVINGGTYTVSAADDAFHSEFALKINNAGTTINVLTCFEGIESLVITINEGNIHILSDDDPINASDGSGGGMTPPMMTMQPSGGNTGGGMPVASNCYLYINGGYIYLNCDNSDGLDSNGSVIMNGGTVIVNGPVNGGNGILDYGFFTMTSGYIIGAGTSDMAQAPGSATSAQYSLLFQFNTSYTDKIFRIETSGGEEVVTFLPAKKYASIVFSSQDLVPGNYRYNIGGTLTPVPDADGMCADGEDYVYTPSGSYTSFTISSTSKVTNVGTN